MNTANILLWIVTGTIAGWLAGEAVRGRGYGLLVDLLLGIAGALVGGFAAGLFGIHAANWVGLILISAAGAVVLVWILHLIHPGSA